MNLEKFSTRELQVYGSISLYFFCKEKNILNQKIMKFICHHISIIITENLNIWETKGLDLEIIGRGEPIPLNISSNIPSNIIKDFEFLIDTCSEIGLVDMYGACTENPYKFVLECIEVLRRNNIFIPNPYFIHKFSSESVTGWGNTIEKINLEYILNSYKINCPMV